MSRDLRLKQPELRDLRQRLLRGPLEFYERLSRPWSRAGRRLRRRRPSWRGPLRPGDPLRRRWREADAMAAYRRAATVNERLVRSNPSDPRALAELARCHGYIGDLQLEGGRLDEAESSYRASHRIREATLPRPARRRRLAFQLARSHRNFGRLNRPWGDRNEAIASYRGPSPSSAASSSAYPDEAETSTTWPGPIQTSGSSSVRRAAPAIAPLPPGGPLSLRAAGRRPSRRPRLSQAGLASASWPSADALERRPSEEAEGSC